MSLKKVPVEITFTKGADTGHDSKLVIPNKFTRVENLEVDRINSLRSRPGFTSHTLTAPEGDAVVGPKRLFALGAELMIESTTGLHALQPNRTINRNPMDVSSAGSVPLSRVYERGGSTLEAIHEGAPGTIVHSGEPFNASCARESVRGRYECYAWVELNSGSLFEVHVKLYDFVAGSTIHQIKLTLPGQNAANPRVVVRNSTNATFFVYYGNANAASPLNLYKISIDGTTGAPTYTNVGATGMANNVATNCIYDVAYSPTADLVYICHQLSAGVGIRHVTLQGADGSTQVDTATTPAVAGALGSLSVVTAPDFLTNNYGIAVFADAANVYVSSAQITGYGGPMPVTVETQIDAASPVGTRGQVQAVINPNLTSQVIAFYDVDNYTAPVSPMSDDIYCNTCSLYGGSIGAGGTYAFAKSVHLAGRPAKYTSNGVHNLAVPAAITSDLQPTVFLLRYNDVAGTSVAIDEGTVRVLARLSPGNSDAAYSTCCEVAGNAYVRLPIIRRGKSTRFSQLQAVTWAPNDALSDLESQRSRFLSGANPSIYDGDRVVEAGFNYYPEGLTAAVRAGGSMTLLGTYSWIMRYEWKDAKGAWHYSAPSVPVTLTLTGANASATLRFPFLRLTEKLTGVAAGATDVRIAFFRTEANGTIYYREAPNSASTTYNVTTGVTMGTWISEVSDAGLLSSAVSEVLHTEIVDGTVDAEAYPAHKIACEHQTRIFMAVEDNYVQYTDVTDELYLAPVTSETYRIKVPNTGGRITGLASMDDKLVIFCQRQIYYVYGEGPDRLGLNNGYSQPQLCSALVGALEGFHNAIVLSPDGLWFYSSQNGLRLLTRGLQLALAGDGNEFVGRDADGFFAAGVSRMEGRIIDGKAQVRFYTVPLSGSAFVAVWDYQQHIWSLFTGHDSAGGSAVASGVFFHASASAVFETGTSLGSQDNGNSHQSLIETGWISMAGIQGFQRVYKLMLLMDALRSPTLSVETGYDYNESYSVVPRFQVAPTVSSPSQYEFAMTIQKCEAIRFRISWTDSAEAVRLTGMSLLVGVKGGLNRLPSTRRL